MAHTIFKIYGAKNWWSHRSEKYPILCRSWNLFLCSRDLISVATGQCRLIHNILAFYEDIIWTSLPALFVAIYANTLSLSNFNFMFDPIWLIFLNIRHRSLSYHSMTKLPHERGASRGKTQVIEKFSTHSVCNCIYKYLNFLEMEKYLFYFP